MTMKNFLYLTRLGCGSDSGSSGGGSAVEDEGSLFGRRRGREGFASRASGGCRVGAADVESRPSVDAHPADRGSAGDLHFPSPVKVLGIEREAKAQHGRLQPTFGHGGRVPNEPLFVRHLLLRAEGVRERERHFDKVTCSFEYYEDRRRRHRRYCLILHPPTAKTSAPATILKRDPPGSIAPRRSFRVNHPAEA